MNHTFISLVFLMLFSTACSQKVKIENEKSEKKIVFNEAMIILHQNSKGEKYFPLKDTIRIPIKTVTTSSGSQTTLNVEFETNDGGRVNSFKLFLPAAPQLKWLPDRNGDFRLKDTKLPYTIDGKDYAPYADALRDSEIFASAYLQSIIKSPSGSATMYFRFEEISIISFEITDGKANMEMKLKLVSEQMSDAAYGSYSAEVHFIINDFGTSMMMVD